MRATRSGTKIAFSLFLANKLHSSRYCFFVLSKSSLQHVKERSHFPRDNRKDHHRNYCAQDTGNVEESTNQPRLTSEQNTDDCK